MALLPALKETELDKIQGDVYFGLPKEWEIFFFFVINSKAEEDFRTCLTNLIPMITTGEMARKDRDAKKAARGKGEFSGVNIAFSHLGVDKFKLKKSGDPLFDAGMLKGAHELGDDVEKWDKDFRKDIDGVILITGHTESKVTEVLATVLKTLGSSVTEVTRATGKARERKDADVRAHEHFGYRDGIAQPYLQGLKALSPGSFTDDEIPTGKILCGRIGDTDSEFTRPKIPMERESWTLDGSFLCFRKLKQLVPEFHEFLEKNKLPTGNDQLPDKLLSPGAELLGARLVGRWRSGAPVYTHNIKDDPKAFEENGFRYDQTTDQKKCPFVAHTRKTNPRADLDGQFNGTAHRRIMRHGIQYGDEVTPFEHGEKKSSFKPELERGLLFACYQSNITEQFHFIQTQWANDKTFVSSLKGVADAGHDALIGVAVGKNEPDQVGSHKSDRLVTAFHPDEEKKSLPIKDHFIITKGGEYFFSPSIASLKTIFAKAPDPKAKILAGKGKEL